MERIKYICNSCNFVFARNANVDFRLCPYCGKTGTVEENNEDYASKILREY